MAIAEPYRSRFLDRRDSSGGADACWPYVAGHDNNGYGVHSIGPKVKERAHRIAVFLDGRDIPKGMTVDHLCRNRTCANPKHLEVIPFGENIRRGGIYRRLPQCSKGHPTPDPSYRTERGNCKVCHNIQTRDRFRRISAARPPRPPRTHCRRGLHPWTPDNIVARSRECRQCQRDRANARNARIRSEK